MRERHVLGPDESLLDLAQSAAERALDAADVSADSLDQILVATMSHDRLTPALAPMLADRLRTSAGAMDVNAACSGFIGALALASGQIESARADRVLVVGAERLSSLSIQPTARPLPSSATARAPPSSARPAARESARSRSAATAPSSELITAERDEAMIHMQGQDTFREAVDRMGRATVDAALAAGVELAEIDHFVFHQANVRILAALTRRLGIDPRARCRSASRASATPRPRPSRSPCATPPTPAPSDAATASSSPAFGAGLTWGATVVEWEARDES